MTDVAVAILLVVLQSSKETRVCLQNDTPMFGLWDVWCVPFFFG